MASSPSPRGSPAFTMWRADKHDRMGGPQDHACSPRRAMLGKSGWRRQLLATQAQKPDFIRLWRRLETSFSGLQALISASTALQHRIELAPVNAWVRQLEQQLSEEPSIEGLNIIEHTLASIEAHCKPLESRAPGYAPIWVAAALRIVREMRDSLKTRDPLLSLLKTAKVVSELIPSPPATSGAKSQAPLNLTPAVITSQRARMFIGSSVEGLTVANALQALLDHDAEVTVWSQGVFGPSSGSLESLVQMAPTFDFAVLVLTPDDVVTKRDKIKNSPRDNVLLELGLFIGTLGRERTYFVHPRAEIELPSDLAGIAPLTYEASRSDKNVQAAVGLAATSIRTQLQRLGLRPKR